MDIKELERLAEIVKALEFAFSNNLFISDEPTIWYSDWDGNVLDYKHKIANIQQLLEFANGK